MTSRNYLSAILFALLVSPAFSQTRDQWVYTNFQAILPNLISILKSDLDPSDSYLLDDIDVIVDERNLTNAFARRNGNNREIVIYNGIILSFDLLAELMAVAQSDADAQCATQYILYMYKNWYDNTMRVSQGLKPNDTLLPESFFNYNEVCDSYASRLDNPSPDAGRAYRDLMESSIYMLFLHELAHHQLGHVDTNPASLEVSRANETEADGWAISRFIEFRGDPVSALPFFLHSVIVGGASLEDEQHSTHPLGARRMVDLIERTEQAYPEDDSGRVYLENLRSLLNSIFFYKP